MLWPESLIFTGYGRVLRQNSEAELAAVQSPPPRMCSSSSLF
jgi:hypothetical protein